MVDEKAASDLSTGMDIYARIGMGNFRNHPGDQRQSGIVQLMSEAMMDDGHDTRITQQYFVNTECSRIAFKCGNNVGIKQYAQTRQCCGKIMHDLVCTGLDIYIAEILLPRSIVQLQTCLREQSIERCIQCMAYIEIFALFAQVRRPQAHRKQNTTQCRNDATQCLT